MPAADRGGNALDADLRAGRRAEREGSNTTRSERAQDERSAGRPPLQMKGRPLTHRTDSASEHSVGPPQRRARPSRLKGVLEARGAAGLKQGVALRRLQLDELDLGRQRGDRGLVLELLRRRGLALCEYEVNCGREWLISAQYRAQLENELTRHLWYSIMARALSIFFFSSARAATS
mgnify:CR=1 FL=1